ncbi:MAG TPA: DUF222 domain-containing protein [Propionicimonas sp.]
MAQGLDERTGSERLAGLRAALDAVVDQPAGLLAGVAQLELLQESLRWEARLHTWVAQLAARIDTAEIAWQEHGTSTATWLADAANLTRREAGRLIAAGHGLARFPLVADAASSGTVLPTQAEAITQVLDELHEDFPADTVREAQQLLVGFAASHNSGELRRLTSHLVGILDPATTEARETAQLDREHRLAARNRYLTFSYDHHGSVLFHGSLPVIEAEPFIQIIDAYAAAQKRGLERLDPHADHVTPAMRRADGLLAMVHHHSQGSLAPNHGGDRPRIVITLTYDKLLADCQDARLLSTGHPVDPGTIRRLLCDADLMPAVLGGPSEVLDVGRSQRLVTPAIRAALELRDGSCVFPGCEVPARDSEAHHIIPWRLGGPTALSNLALLCAHHHGTIEPSPNPHADRWKVQLRHDSVPAIIPPLRVDPHQGPRLHARFHTRRRD